MKILTAHGRFGIRRERFGQTQSGRLLKLRCRDRRNRLYQALSNDGIPTALLANALEYRRKAAKKNAFAILLAEGAFLR